MTGAVHSMLERVGRDARRAARALIRVPGFVAIATVMLTLGIGANAAVVTVIDQLLVRPPGGVANPERVRRVTQDFTVAMTHDHRSRAYFSYPELEAVMRSLPRGTSVAAFAPLRAAIGRGDVTESINGESVFGDFFGLLGVHAEVGRLFSRDEVGRVGPTRVAVISDAEWRTQFGGRADITNQSMLLDGDRYRIIGVAASQFRGVGLDAANVWVPLNTSPLWRDTSRITNPVNLTLQMLLRVGHPGGATTLQSLVTRTLHELRVTGDAAAQARLLLISDLLDPQSGKTTVAIVTRLFIGALAILLIACANVGGLLMTRAAERRQELTIRFALGGSRRRIASEVAFENVLLVAAAGAVAFIAATLDALALRNLLLPHVSWTTPVVGWRLVASVVGFAALIGLGASAGAFGYVRERALALGLRMGRLDSGGRSIGRDVFVVVQTALSVALLFGASLMLTSLRHVEALDIGYHADDVVVGYSPVDLQGMWKTDPMVRSAALELASVPAAQSVALSSIPPLFGISWARLSIPGVDSVALPPGVQISRESVSPAYFATMGIRVRRGRVFTPADGPDAERVIIVSAALARVYWPARDAISRCLIVRERKSECWTVIAVVDDVHAQHLFENPWMHVYLPLAQTGDPYDIATALLVRARPGRARELLPIVRSALTTAAHDAPQTWHLQTFVDQLAPELAPWRISAALFTALGKV